ncbi:MAG: nucleoside triphosphate pyrophosphohydrolase [Cellvibrionaceae bacterium]|nr:nucleoside triphosphate pyrophosphohydrolase [Cellvibrionaceae bacterium]
MSMYTIEDLHYLMIRLRRPEDGCPWDLKQDYVSILPSTIEEVYELVAAIENRDFANLKEELGDLLFQVVFYSQLAEEEQRFGLVDVVDGLVEKLLRRHPHVFPDGTLQSHRDKSLKVDESSIKQNWEKIKETERGDKGLPGLMADIPQALPAMMRAQKLQKRAAKVGFDWTQTSAVLEKLKEEVAELEHAIEVREANNIDNTGNVEEEFGDLLFSCVNLARHLNLDPERSLRQANAKFQQRIQFIEKKLEGDGKGFSDLSEQELDQLWLQAKANLVSEG